MLSFLAILILQLVNVNCEQIEFSVQENAKIGSVIGNIYTNSYKNENNTKMELIKSDNSGENYFTLKKDSGELKVRSLIDRESICEENKMDDCSLMLLADRGADVLQIKITIKDVNDNAPVFLVTQKTIPIQENIDPGTEYFLPVAQDSDTIKFGVNNYSISNFRSIDSKNRENYSTKDLYFQIEGGTSPRLKVVGNIDREEIVSFIFLLIASDSGHKTGSCTITVLITDVNDNSPEWKKDNYKVRIRECQIQGEILDLDATDRDDPNTNNGRISYRFSDRTKDKDKMSHIFYINGNKLYLSNNRPSELGNTGQLKLFINAADGNGRMKEAAVEITIEDCNDHPPVISIANRYSQVMENTKERVYLTLVTVKDNDRGRNGIFDCQLNDSSVLNLVKKHINPAKNVIYYKIETIGDYDFDREKISVYTVEIRCTDQGQPSLSSTQKFSINVADQNDNSPKFEDKTLILHLQENNAIGSTVGQVKAVDADSGLNGHVRYNVLRDNEYFTVSNYGEIQSKVKFDREEKENYEFVLIATDSGNPPLNDTMTVQVVIRDMNDCAPIFNEEYVFKVTESYGETIKNERVGEVKATDRDFGVNGTVNYKVISVKFGGSTGSSILKSQLERLVRISFDGGISVYGNLDREVISSIQLTVEAYDNGNPRLSTQTTVVMEILDINDNAPNFVFPNKFKKYLNISIESDIGTNVGSVLTEDPDQGVNGTISHSIIGGDKQSSFPFKIESDGKVTVVSDLKKFSKTMRLPDNCLIRATDLGTPSKSSIATLYLHYYDAESYPSHKNSPRTSSESSNLEQKNKNKSYNDNAHLNSTISDNMMLLYCLAAILFFVFIIVFSVLLYVYCTRAYSTSDIFPGYSKKLYKENNSHISLNPNMKELQQMTINAGEIHECSSGKNEDRAAVCLLNDYGSNYTHLMMLNNNKYTTMAHSMASPNNFQNPNDCSQQELMCISQNYLNSTNHVSSFQSSSPNLSKTSVKKTFFPTAQSSPMANCSQNYSTLHDKLIFNSINRKSSPRALTTVDKNSDPDGTNFCQPQKDFNSPYVTSSFV